MLRGFYLACGVALLAAPLWRQGQTPTHAQASPAASGRSIFSSACAGCHGLDGRGGERAPSLTGSTVRRLSDRELFAIVSKGIPGTAMPAFQAIAPGERRALIAYVRGLQGEKRAAPFPGDPRRGQSLFFGKAKCSTCHMVNGEGGFIASDLSAYGRRHSPEEIRQRIVAPQPDGQGGARIATVITNDGKKYRGVVRNEDNFSLQLQSLDGAFHLFTRSELEGVEYATEPLMPSDYGSRLTRNELDDIIRYIQDPGSPTSTTPRKGQQ